jgi:hypothetical protein
MESELGAVTFSIDTDLVSRLKKSLPLNLFVETGTFHGDTTFSLIPYFDRLITIEFSEPLCIEAKARFNRNANVEVLHGSSPEVLEKLRPIFDESPALFWLDAHWCVANDTAGELSQCPLLFELRAIGALHAESVILIDDARLFLAPPIAPHEVSHWPRLHQIIDDLIALSPVHEIMIVNDVIAFYPKRIIQTMNKYAQDCGVDWLLAANCMKQEGTSFKQLEEKESKICELNADLQLKETAINEKEREIRILASQINLYGKIFSIPLIGRGLRLINRIRIILTPRLGNLNQYPPRSICERVTQPKSKCIRGELPIVSIVTPSFQQGRFLAATIHSVLGQNYPKLEYFVQDGFSTDETVDVLMSFGEDCNMVWHSESDSGQSDAINRGFKQSTGDIMGWINSDDIMMPETLMEVVQYFNCNRDVDVVYGNRLLIDKDGMEIGRWILPGHDDKVLSWVDYVPQETLFWRRHIWEKAGGKIDESFRFAMDWDLLVRFRDAGAKFAHIPQFLGAFRVHESQKTSASIRNIGHQEMDRIRQRVLGRVPSRKEIRAATFPYLLKHVAIDVLYRIRTRLKGRV